MRKCLVIVDMQNDFVTGNLGTKEAVAIVPNVVAKVKQAIADGTKVVFTRDTHTSEYMNTQEGKNLPVPHCINGTEGWDIIPELQEFITDETYIFDKPTFGSVKLADDVTFNCYDEVELIGVCTGICVLSNAIVIKAHNPEVPIKVDSSCCACVTPETHETALKAMQTCQIQVV